ncbi:2-hydroxyacid dehydrogenase, partial [Sinorhizobium meliloti]|nr:2-hydroxyacid dehydrogenase [Sinorhizobium meliloti]MDW9838238.1 2-hydroxyacid dehydrogenase [Sinorhizobium meliloti]MDX0091706.1 2-hydroxyacid dehydrogenase [Sinorhizobium meliloti]
MPKIELLQVGPYPSWDDERLNSHFTMHRYFEAADKAAFLATHGVAIRGIATRGELGANRAMIEALPKLEIISVYGVGYDAVDLAAARERGVRVTNTPDVLTKDVADLGVAMMLAHA